ncbi:MAG: glycosyltransferase family 4 protein [Bacteroidia bacterium]|nr:glycosyltransferase family 4 protein [Bacteroidia bacterium]
MRKVLWQTRSVLVADSIRNGKLAPDANGGNAYDFHAATALSEKFKVDVDESALMKSGDSLWKYWRRMSNENTPADIIIREPYPIVFGSTKLKTPCVGMIHHIDDVLGKSSIKHRWYFNRLKRRLPKLDLVITVSSYWREYLESLGCKNVKVIHNGFNHSEYVVSETAVQDFRTRHNIPKGKPLIYAGNATRQKGIYAVYEALKDKGYHLLMSGSQNQAADLNVQYLHMDRKEYISMLHACDLVITMSRMTEGWNRIAHEALLCGTPVIGSGVGGMKELLNGAGQMIVTDEAKLAVAVQEVLHRSAWYVENGKKFVLQFDMNYFRKQWTNTISDLLSRA